MFTSLQGLTEVEKYALLTKAVNGEVDISQIKMEAKRMKGLQAVRIEFQLLTKKRSWQECCREYPDYTRDCDLEQFIGEPLCIFSACIKLHSKR